MGKQHLELTRFHREVRSAIRRLNPCGDVDIRIVPGVGCTAGVLRAIESDVRRRKT